MTGLKGLYLGWNQLTLLPEEIVALTGLTSLDLRNNPLDKPQSPAVEAWIAGLKASGCKVDGDITGHFLSSSLAAWITSLPAVKLAGLKKLELHDIKLTSLPGEIGLMTALKELNLFGNQLTSLPEEIGLMTGLKTLSLERNQLTSLPEEIGLMTGLETLNLSGNQLTSLPEDIVALTGLTSLSLGNNPLVQPQSPAIEAWIAGLKASGCNVSR